MIKIHDVAQGTPAWHKLRKGLWTGSRAIKLLQGKPLPDDSGIYQSAAMRRGKVLEPIAIQEYEQQTGIEVMRPGFITNTKYRNAGYSPDGIHGETLLEVKCLNGKKHEALVEGNIPTEYLAQIYFGLVICELKEAKLLAFNPEYPEQLTVIEVDIDKKALKNIRAKLKTDYATRQVISLVDERGFLTS